MGRGLKWSRLNLKSPFSKESFFETIDGGQAFRWKRIEEDVLQGQWLQNVVRVKWIREETLEYKIVLGAVTKTELSNYIGDDKCFVEQVDQLPWRSDKVLSRAMDLYPGLRIMSQPIEEVLLGFLCSSNKQIIQIKQMCENLATMFGESLGEGYYALPTWERLASVSIDELKKAKLGYRAKYIHNSALLICEQPNFFETLKSLSYEESVEHIMQLPGVGRKVADCVLLFGGGFRQAFPIDTWIQKIMVVQYELEGWTDKQIRHFAIKHFGLDAGLAQQYLFSQARHNG